MKVQARQHSGFTIVELLIVIVVIAILAAISIVAYNGIQTRARDSQRSSDISAIVKGLELYYIDKGSYPTVGGSTSPGMNSGWATTADASWQNLVNALKPYASNLGADPTSTAGVWNAFNYSYYYNINGSYCNTASGQMFILTYKFENTTQKNTLTGDCNGTVLGPYGGMSNYRVVK